MNRRVFLGALLAGGSAGLALGRLHKEPSAEDLSGAGEAFCYTPDPFGGRIHILKTGEPYPWLFKGGWVAYESQGASPDGRPLPAWRIRWMDRPAPGTRYSPLALGRSMGGPRPWSLAHDYKRFGIFTLPEASRALIEARNSYLGNWRS